MDSSTGHFQTISCDRSAHHGTYAQFTQVCYASLQLSHRCLCLAIRGKLARLVEPDRKQLEDCSRHLQPIAQTSVASKVVDVVTVAPKAKYVPPHMRAKYVPPHLRKHDSTVVQTRATSPQLQTFEKSLFKLGRTSSECSLASTATGISEFGRTISECSVASTATGISSAGRTSSECSVSSPPSPRGRRRVRFNADADEVHHVNIWSKSVLTGCEAEGSCWYTYASRRAERFRIICHGERTCRGKGCTCDAAEGLCSRGGELAQEVSPSNADIFTAWRRLAKIPATVPYQRLKQGLDWPRRAR